MHYHLILTDDCNLCCTYCRGKLFEVPAPEHQKNVVIDESLPSELAVDLTDLYRFLEKDPHAGLTFYGGEPMMRPDLIREIMENASVEVFIIHTNATLLDSLEPEYTNRFSTIYVSIDGPERLTDHYRGMGTYRRIIENLCQAREQGYRGELIARMTVTEETDIEEAVTGLADNEDFSFSSIHWQIDANFWNDYGMRDFGRWAEESYNPGIRHLVRRWVDLMHRDGRVLRWYPFLGAMQDMLLHRKSPLRCGSGFANYSIMTDGNIAACPCMVGMKDYYLGNIATTEPSSLRTIDIGNECTDCDIRDFCGGRCLYSNILQPWPAEGRAIICNTVQVLHDTLAEVQPEIETMIRDGEISLSDFEYTKYQGCEIIP